jgi:prolyl-tRNA editing enzyme YbaK/EbsC (Cys-tRNA(Pro) deacylase)
MAKVVLNAKGIHDFHRLVVDQILNRLRVVVKGGDRGMICAPTRASFNRFSR